MIPIHLPQTFHKLSVGLSSLYNFCSIPPHPLKRLHHQSTSPPLNHTTTTTTNQPHHRSINHTTTTTTTTITTTTTTTTTTKQEGNKRLLVRGADWGGGLEWPQHCATTGGGVKGGECKRRLEMGDGKAGDLGLLTPNDVIKEPLLLLKFLLLLELLETPRFKKRLLNGELS